MKGNLRRNLIPPAVIGLVLMAISLTSAALIGSYRPHVQPVFSKLEKRQMVFIANCIAWLIIVHWAGII